MASEKVDLKKRFYLFAYQQCYPIGGLEDISGCYDTLDEAKAAAEAQVWHDYTYVFDRVSCEVVYNRGWEPEINAQA